MSDYLLSIRCTTYRKPKWYRRYRASIYHFSYCMKIDKFTIDSIDNVMSELKKAIYEKIKDVDSITILNVFKLEE